MKIVVKLGGHSLDDLSPTSEVLASLASDIKMLIAQGHRICVVHGGGPQINQMLNLAGVHSEFVEGLRVTSPEAMNYLQMALAGVNAALVAFLNANEIQAVGLSGLDTNLAIAELAGEPWGQVGFNPKVETSLIEMLWETSMVPVVSPVVSDGRGTLLNCNADELAGAFTGKLAADVLVLLSDVDQLRADPHDATTGLNAVHVGELEEMILDGRINGGMIPKARAAIAGCRHGANRVVIANAAVPRVLEKILSNDAITTEVMS